MSDCASIRTRLYAFLDEELPDVEAAEVRAHLESCDRCRAAHERERAFLGALAAAGKETAPPGLRRRVEAVLESGAAPVASRGRGRRVSVLLAAAAVAALLLVVRPWEGGGRGDGPGVAFAADHHAHAVSAPSAAPFPLGQVPRPPLALAPIQGLSRCVVAGRAYAHFAYLVEGVTISVFVPLDGSPPPDAASREGPATVVAVEGEGGRPGAVLVSDELGEPALRRLWRQG